MNDLLTLDQAAAVWKSLKKKHPSIPAMPAQSLRVHARSEGLAGEIVDGALYIRKDSLLKMVKGLRVWEAAWGADLEDMVIPVPALSRDRQQGTAPVAPKETAGAPHHTTKAEWQADVLAELRAIRELLAKALSGTTAAGV
jgi:hypothetical protein